MQSREFSYVLRSVNSFPCRCDRVFGADQQTQMAANALFTVQNGFSLFTHRDCLMTAVTAGDGASAAANALFTVKFREDHGIALQDIGVRADGVQCQTNCLADIGEAFF